MTIFKVNPPPGELEPEQSHLIDITMVKEVSRNMISRFIKEGTLTRHIEQAFRFKTKPIIVYTPPTLYEVYEKQLFVLAGHIIIALILAVIVVTIYQRWLYRSKTSDKGWKTNEVCINDFANISDEEESDKFSCFGHTWCLAAVTSDSWHLGTKGTIGVYLHSPDIDTDIGIVFSLAIKDSKGRILRLHNICDVFTRICDTNGRRVNYPTFCAAV